MGNFLTGTSDLERREEERKRALRESADPNSSAVTTIRLMGFISGGIGQIYDLFLGYQRN